MSNNIEAAAMAACATVGIIYKAYPFDGLFHVTDSTDGKPRNGAGRIKFFADGLGGIACNWRTAHTQAFFVNGTATAKLDPAELERIKREQQKRESEKLKGYDRAALKAVQIWNKAAPAPIDHPYLITKQIKPHGARLAAWERTIVDSDGIRQRLVIENCLVLPLYDATGKICSVQAIFPAQHKLLGRGKDFLPGGQLAGLFWWIAGKPDKSDKSETVLVCEGFATAATLREETNYRVYMAFTANNLLAVAKIVREKLPDAHIILAADNDTETAGNPGLSKATAAAQAVDGSVIVPPIPNADFNDYAAYLKAVSNEQ